MNSLSILPHSTCKQSFQISPNHFPFHSTPYPWPGPINYVIFPHAYKRGERLKCRFCLSLIPLLPEESAVMTSTFLLITLTNEHVSIFISTFSEICFLVSNRSSLTYKQQPSFPFFSSFSSYVNVLFLFKTDGK